MMPHETFTNSFIVNALLMNIWMHSCTFWLIDLFRGYFRGTQAAIFFQVIAKNQVFYGWAFKEYVFNTAAIVWIFLVLIYMSLKPREKINDDLIKKKDLSSQ